MLGKHSGIGYGDREQGTQDTSNYSSVDSFTRMIEESRLSTIETLSTLGNTNKICLTINDSTLHTTKRLKNSNTPQMEHPAKPTQKTKRTDRNQEHIERSTTTNSTMQS